MYSLLINVANLKCLTSPVSKTKRWSSNLKRCHVRKTSSGILQGKIGRGWTHPGKEATPTENALKRSWGFGFDPLWIDVSG